MLIKIEIDKDIKDTTEFKKEFCKKNDCLWIDSYYNDSEIKLPISADYGEYWIEGDYSEECKWEICDDYHLHSSLFSPSIQYSPKFDLIGSFSSVAL